MTCIQAYYHVLHRFRETMIFIEDDIAKIDSDAFAVLSSTLRSIVIYKLASFTSDEKKKLVTDNAWTAFMDHIRSDESPWPYAEALLDHCIEIALCDSEIENT